MIQQRPEVPDRGAQLGRQVEGRAGPPALGSESRCRGLKTPKQKNPARIVLVPRRSTKRFYEVSRQVDWRFRVALVLAHETGHRIGAIRKLQRSDIDMEGKNHPLARRAREVGLRAPDAGHRRGARRLGGGAKEEPS